MCRHRRSGLGGQGENPCAQHGLRSPSTCVSEPFRLEGESSVTFQASEPTHTSWGEVTAVAEPAGGEGCRLATTEARLPGPPRQAFSFRFFKKPSKMKGDLSPWDSCPLLGRPLEIDQASLISTNRWVPSPGLGVDPTFPSVKTAPPLSHGLSCRKPHRWWGPLSITGARTLPPGRHVVPQPFPETWVLRCWPLPKALALR